MGNVEENTPSSEQMSSDARLYVSLLVNDVCFTAFPPDLIDPDYRDFYDRFRVLFAEKFSSRKDVCSLYVSILLGSLSIDNKNMIIFLLKGAYGDIDMQHAYEEASAQNESPPFEEVRGQIQRTLCDPQSGIAEHSLFPDRQFGVNFLIDSYFYELLVGVFDLEGINIKDEEDYTSKEVFLMSVISAFASHAMRSSLCAQFALEHYEEEIPADLHAEILRILEVSYNEVVYSESLDYEPPFTFVQVKSMYTDYFGTKK